MELEVTPRAVITFLAEERKIQILGSVLDISKFNLECRPFLCCFCAMKLNNIDFKIKLPYRLKVFLLFDVCGCESF